MSYFNLFGSLLLKCLGSYVLLGGSNEQTGNIPKIKIIEFTYIECIGSHLVEIKRLNSTNAVYG